MWREPDYSKLPCGHTLTHAPHVWTDVWGGKRQCGGQREMIFFTWLSNNAKKQDR